MTPNLESIAYFQGDYRKLADCNVNIMTHALQYGTMVFGGVRGYYNKDKNNLYIFRLEDHVARIFQSARIMQMKSPITPAEMSNVLLELARKK